MTSITVASFRQGVGTHRAWIIVGAGLLCMYGPSFYDLSQTLWMTEAQGHGPLVLGLAIWLVWRKWDKIDAGADGRDSMPLSGGALIVASCAAYFIGRALDFALFEVGSLVPLLAGIVLMLRGPRQLAATWFALFFLVFMVPLPAVVVDALTQPLKMAVSTVVEQVLYWFGYPISRTGVMLSIGQYQLLVADACAGLNTLFTLESLGLFYLNVVRSSSALRNVVLAILIVPISFLANVTRVVVLCLITYYFGDEAGQGFLHGFAGMVLFLSALCFILVSDGLLRMLDVRLRAAPAPAGTA